MKSFAWRSRAPFALAVLAALACAARAEAPVEFAATIPLVVQGGEALQRVELPVAVYANAQFADLRDVRVFNAANELVPYALIGDAPPAPAVPESFSPPVFPVWGIPTDVLAEEMMAGGLRARLTCVDPKKVPTEFAGREWDASLLAELPEGVDPCGENGEFHSFCWAGPMFSGEIQVLAGERVERDGFVYAELVG